MDCVCDYISWGDSGGQTRNLAFQCLFRPEERSRAGTHDLVCCRKSGILPGGRRCSGGWVGGHPPNRGGDEIVTTWGFEPVS